MLAAISWRLACVGLGGEATIGSPLAHAGWEGAIPDVPVTDRVAVVLQFERAGIAERTGLGASAVAGGAFERGVVLHEHAV